MNILIVNRSVIPAFKHGGVERVIWDLGRELFKRGHNITYLVAKGSSCPFADIITLDPSKDIDLQIPENIDIVHLNSQPKGKISKPYIVSVHRNFDNVEKLDINSVFVSKNHATRHNSDCFVYNGLNWSNYANPDIKKTRDTFHFLAKASNRNRNLKGAIDIIRSTECEHLNIIGGDRVRSKGGFRKFFTSRATYHNLIGGEQKFKLLNSSKGLIFPVLWHEPFGLSIIESLYFGNPIFGTPYGSLPEIVTDQFGTLSSKKSELVYALSRCNDFSKNRCREYAEDIFNSSRMTSSYMKLYEKILNGENLNKEQPKSEGNNGDLLSWN